MTDRLAALEAEATPGPLPCSPEPLTPDLWTLVTNRQMLDSARLTITLGELRATLDAARSTATPEGMFDDGADIVECVARSTATPGLDYADTWAAFQRWEDKAARNGSGMTRDQMTGASMMLGWLRDRVAATPTASPTEDDDESRCLA